MPPLWAGLTPNALLGLSVEYPDVLKYLTSRIKTSVLQNATAFFAAKQNSFTQSIQEFGRQDIYGYFIGGKPDLVDSPVLNNAFNNDGTMGAHGVPKVSLFIYTAINDEASPINTTQALVDKYCSAGANIIWEWNTVGGYIAEQTNGDASAVAWLIDILVSDAEKETCGSTRCLIQDVTLNSPHLQLNIAEYP